MATSTDSAASLTRAVATGRWVLASFAAVVVTFSAATIGAYSAARTIDQAADDIARNAMPSVRYLSAARGELRRAVLLLDDTVHDGLADAAGDTVELARTRERLWADLRAYAATPAFPGEAGLWSGAHAELVAFDAALGQAIAEHRAGDDGAAQRTLRRRVRSAEERADVAIEQVITLNSWQADAQAYTIERARRRAALVAFALDTLSALVAAVSGWGIWRATRRAAKAAAARESAAEERADELEQFAGRVAHDIRGPLTTVGLALERADDDRATPADARESLGRARRSLGRVVQVVDGLFEFARAGAHPTRGAATPLADAVADVVTECGVPARDARIELAVEPLPACAVACSPGVLMSLLSNLVRNAIKYTGAGGDGRRVVVRAIERGRFVRVEVEDRGVGVPPSMRTAIFEPYVRVPGRAQEGLGLGLATVRRAAEAHGGSVGMRPSDAGVGSVFWFELPKAEAPAGSVAPEAAPPPQHPARSAT